MLNQETRERITQSRLSALMAVFLHKKRIWRFRRKGLWVEFLAIAVPVFYIVPRFLLKGRPEAERVEVVWELLAASLLVATILKTVYRWQDRETRHSVMSRQNEDMALEALEMLAREAIAGEVLAQFFKRVADINKEDRELFLDATQKEDQKAYREALKQLHPGVTTLCSKCSADPWKFKKGACAACGGTAVSP